MTEIPSKANLEAFVMPYSETNEPVNNQINYVLYQHPLGLTFDQLQEATNLSNDQIHESLKQSSKTIRRLTSSQEPERVVHFGAYTAQRILEWFCKNNEENNTFSRGKLVFINSALVGCTLDLDESEENPKVIETLEENQVLYFRQSYDQLHETWYVGNLEKQRNGEITAKNSTQLQKLKNTLALAYNNDEALPTPPQAKKNKTTYPYGRLEEYQKDGELDLGKTLQDALQEDQTAINLLFDYTKHMMYIFLQDPVFTHDETEDQVQESLIKLFLSFPRYTFAEFKDYQYMAYRIALNTKRDHLRKHHINDLSLEQVLYTNPDIEPVAVPSELSYDEVYPKLKQYLIERKILREIDIEILELVEGKDLTEASIKLGISYSAAASRYSRALDRIEKNREQIQKIYQEEI